MTTLAPCSYGHGILADVMHRENLDSMTPFYQSSFGIIKVFDNKSRKHVKEIEADFDAAVKGSQKLVVIDFYATWCGPCKMIGPKLEAIAQEMADKLEVLKVDVDENEETAAACGISAMPTFHFYKNGSKVDELVGASEEQLRALITKNL